jgi:dipeptidyl aminopeptidase/acylaminoacyl peptidase
MAGDPRIQAAIDHWAPRYVENGVPIGDFLGVTSSIDSWDDWCAAWSERGAIHETEGDRALSEERFLSAGYHYATAAVCFHFGKFLFVHDLEQMQAAHARAVAVHRKAHPHLRPPVERVEIPYGGHHLVGNLRKPDSGRASPVVVMIPGLDSAKEELTSNEMWFLDRGMATFTIDGPGQGESEYEMPIEPRYEMPVAAVIDVLEQRADIDPDRIGAWGVSLGGYYVVRAAAFEPRLKAIISLSGPFRFADAWDQLPPMTKAAIRVRFHTETDGEARERLEEMDLTGVAERVTCPAYVMGGDQDRIVPPEGAVQIAAGVSGPVVLNMIRGGNHVSSNKPYLYRPESADWMAARLSAS